MLRAKEEAHAQIARPSMYSTAMCMCNQSQRRGASCDDCASRTGIGANAAGGTPPTARCPALHEVLHAWCQKAYMVLLNSNVHSAARRARGAQYCAHITTRDTQLALCGADIQHILPLELANPSMYTNAWWCVLHASGTQALLQYSKGRQRTGRAWPRTRPRRRTERCSLHTATVPLKRWARMTAPWGSS